ncbi:MAG TPA: response regulator [Myxococcota bacterium]
MSGTGRSEMKRKILIVDDAPMFRELESLFLARSGRVLTASSGSEALEVARRELPDVVVADYSMPGMRGDALCREIKSDPDLRKTPVIIVTSCYEEDEHENAVRAGADDVIEKPVNRLTLIQAVNRFLRLAVRGLVRVPLEAEVRLGLQSCEAWGHARNISRGGIFVESEAGFEPDTEVELEFLLPNATDTLAPTARVVWRRVQSSTTRPGLGLQFLKLDRNVAKQLDDYVYERAATQLTADGADAPVLVR